MVWLPGKGVCSFSKSEPWSDHRTRQLETYAQGVAKVGSQLQVQHKSLFLHYYLRIIVLFSVRTTVNLRLPHPVYAREHRKHVHFKCVHECS